MTRSLNEYFLRTIKLKLPFDDKTFEGGYLMFLPKVEAHKMAKLNGFADHKLVKNYRGG